MPPIELQRMHTEPLAQAEIESGSCLHPPALQVKFREAVPDEEVAAHEFEQLLCGEVVAHICISQACRNAHRSRCCRKQGCFRNAETAFGEQAITRSEVFMFFASIIWIVKNFVPYRVAQFHRA